MALCYVDGGYPIEECQRPARFADMLASATAEVVLVGEFDASGGYAIELTGPYQPIPPPSKTLRFTGGEFVTPVTVTRGFDVTFLFTRLGDLELEETSKVTATLTRHSDQIVVNGATLTLAGATLTGQAEVVAKPDSAVTVRWATWSNLNTPVLDVRGGTLSLDAVSMTDLVGNDAAIKVDDTFVMIAHTEACGLEGPFLAGGCTQDTSGPDLRPTCRVSGSTFQDGPADRPLLDLDELWTLDRVSLAGPAEVAGNRTWGFAGSEVTTTNVHVWPAAGSADAALPGMRATPVLDPPTPYFTPPDWAARCQPLIPDPQFLGFDPSNIPGALGERPTALTARYGAWWVDAGYADLDLDGLADGDNDGVPAMWDCYPYEDQPLRSEVPGNAIDEDCDGYLRCGVDDDGDGYTVTVQVERDLQTETPCPATSDEVDPDDQQECVVPVGEELPPRCQPDPEPPDSTEPRPITGFSGSGCRTGPGPTTPLAALAVGILLTRRQRRR